MLYAVQSVGGCSLTFLAFEVRPKNVLCKGIVHPSSYPAKPFMEASVAVHVFFTIL